MILALICSECLFTQAEIKEFCDNRDEEASNGLPLQPPRLLLAAVTTPFPRLNSAAGTHIRVIARMLQPADVQQLEVYPPLFSVYTQKVL